MWLIDFGSTEISLGAVPSPYAPCPRGRTTRACNMPGSRMLCTYVYVPLTLAGMSMRGGPGAFPTSAYWASDFVPGAPGSSPGPAVAGPPKNDGTDARW